MRYSILADTYEELESTTKKLVKSDIISKLLKKTPADVLEPVVLLLNGQVFPVWSAKEIGVAHQLIIKAIAKATGESSENIVKQYKKLGDLGLVADFFISKKKQRTLDSEELTVKKVFKNLQEIAVHTGTGSQDKKLSLIAELLSQASPKEARYVVKTVLEELRIGVAEGLIRDAIAKAFDATAEEVEAAWSVLPDYGEIATIAKEKGHRGLEKVELKFGVPIQVLLAEKVPTLKDAYDEFAPHIIFEYKYDGMRGLLQKKGSKVWVFTRRMEDVTAAFPEVVEYVRKNVKADNIVLDSEVLGISPKTGKPMPFQMLSTRIKRKYDIEKATKEMPVQVNLFDIIYLNGKSLIDLPLRERREILAKNIHEVKGKFQRATFLIPTSFEETEKFYHESLDAGHEGLIAKNLEAKYVPGRRVAGGWLKIKPTLENLDVVIVGGTWGSGKRAGTIGSLSLGIRDADTGKFLECGMLGTGLKEKKTEEGDVTLTDMTKMLRPLITWEEGHNIKIKPKVVIEVAYEEIQKSPTYESGYALRFPRFIRLRLDKGPDEADDTNRLKKIYDMQKGRAK
jgi:DNA ligase-1